MVQTHANVTGRKCDDAIAMSVDEAGRLLGIGRTLAWQLVKAGELKVVRLSGRTLVTRQAIEELLAKAAA